MRMSQSSRARRPGCSRRRRLGAWPAPATAQEKVWKHGLIKAKADAGIFLMVTHRATSPRNRASSWRPPNSATTSSHSRR